MCDMKQYEGIYEKLKTLAPDELSQLADNSSSDEEKNFYYSVMNFFLQQRQAEVIKKGIF